ncbi:isochorismatase family protein [Pseudooceanicola sp. LIPI14-2-Ac024]|uniref:isochorismatase family protein n=1 Tax=Pseudooceanicola sp. LIPI14-2-Ac024 TaxID=3344875 RepID=UPI0035CF3E91
MHQPLTLPRERTALLLIDLQEEHRADPRYLVDGYDAVLTACARLLAAARMAGTLVLHAAYLRDFSRVPPRPFEPVESDGSPAFSAPGGSLTEICNEVRPGEGEMVFYKNDLSCFTDAAFLDHLLDQPEWLVICGVWTEACVSATVRDAIQRGIRVLLVKDACGSGTATMHEAAILNLANRLYGGAVCDTATALDLLAGGTAQVWRLQGAAPLRYDAASITSEYAAL